MGLKWFRLNEKVQFSIIVASVIAVLVGFLPNYESMIYAKTEFVGDFEAQNHIGYPARKDVPELTSREEVLKKGKGYTLVVDAKSIKPLHIYLWLSDHSFPTSAFQRFLNRDENQKAVGQLFSVVLKNGDTMIVLLDDYAVKLPRSGKVRLPIGKTEKMKGKPLEYLEERYDFSEDEMAYYIDMAGSWRKSKIAEEIETVRIFVFMLTFIIAVIGTYILTEKLERKERERADKRRESERGN